MNHLEITTVGTDDRRDEVVRLLARGLRDNPIHVAALGDDAERRQRDLERLYSTMLSVGANEPLLAIRDGELVAVLGSVASPHCQPSWWQTLRMTPTLLRLGRRSVAVGRWGDAWSSRDPDEDHLHFGPIATDPAHQRTGIGTALMIRRCERLDAEGAVGYLETDVESNVRFYERFGFEVVDTAEVLGVESWFMRRAPRQHDA
ncbi:MAG: GNAT family N-acetyltransferase [Solirubrobacterales bacterium]